MLPDSPDVRDVVFGENGLARRDARGHSADRDEHDRPGDCDRGQRRRCNGKAASALDAPVSGGDKGAIAGTLSIMVGGNGDGSRAGDAALRGDGQDDRPRWRTGRGPDRQGLQPGRGRAQLRGRQRGTGAGRTRPGSIPNKVAQVLGGGLANSRVMEMRGPTMIEHNFQPGFRVNLHRKDLGIALSTGRETGVAVAADRAGQPALRRCRLPAAVNSIIRR